MNAPSPSSADRDLRVVIAHLTNPQVLGVLVVVWAVLTIAGPFNTLVDLSLPVRALYWGLVVSLTYATGTTVTQIIGVRICNRVAPLAVGMALSALCVSLSVFLVLVVLNSFFVPQWVSDPLQAMIVFASVLLVSFAILFLRHTTLGEIGVPHPKLAMILERLPLDKRGALVSLSVQDHYVDIVTVKGREMVLMRLSDAMREAAEVPGMQIHRSHWVALDQIKSVTRAGDAARVTLSNGVELPVSRGFLPAVREAGLLPKTRSAKSGG